MRASEIEQLVSVFGILDRESAHLLLSLDCFKLH